MRLRPGPGRRNPPPQVITLPQPGGDQVQVTFEDTAPAETVRPGGITGAGPFVTWPGVTVPHATSFADLYLWLGGSEPGFCKVATGEGTRLPADPEPPGAGMGRPLGHFPLPRLLPPLVFLAAADCARGAKPLAALGEPGLRAAADCTREAALPVMGVLPLPALFVPPPFPLPLLLMLPISP